MSYKLETLVENVQNTPIINKEFAYYIEKITKRLIKLNLKTFNKDFNSNFKFNRLFEWNNLFHIEGNLFLSSDLIYQEIEISTIKELNIGDVLSLITTYKHLLIYKTVNLGLEKVHYYCYYNNQIKRINDSIRNPKILINEFIYCTKNSNLKCYYLSTGTQHWQKEFSANIHQIEVWGERVVVVETVGRETNTFYSLKANTGETIWQYDAAKLKIIDNKVFGVVHTHSELTLIHFNPLKEEPIFKYNITNLVFNFFKSLPFFKFTIDEAKLFISFTSLNTLMIIDLEKMVVEWHHKVETDASWIGEPKVSGNRLYVLDEANTLHIFEKEESEE